MLASEAVGWNNERYRENRTAYVVRELRGVHLREARYGEPLDTRTCIAESRRGLVLRRETWVADVMRTSVDWAHIGPTGAPQRPGPEVVEAFAVTPAEPVHLPGFTPREPIALPDFEVVPWFTEMDPIGHTNHPRYVDWADEALSRHLAASGVDPLRLVPVAESFRFRAPTHAAVPIQVRLRYIGDHQGATVHDVGFVVGDTSVCQGRLWRTLAA